MVRRRSIFMPLLLIAALALFGMSFAQDEMSGDDQPRNDIVADDVSGDDDGDDGADVPTVGAIALDRPQSDNVDDDVVDDDVDDDFVPAKPKEKKSKKDKTASGSAASAAKVAAPAKTQKAGTDFRLSGIVETGYDMRREFNRKGPNETKSYMINKGEIEISARPAKGVRAEIGLEFNQRGSTHDVWPWDMSDAIAERIGPYLTVDKFLVQYNMPWDGSFRAGIMKKSFGLEERAGVDERYFHARSRINGELDGSHGFLDHDLTLQYRHDLAQNTLRFVGGLSWAVADSLRYLQNYSVQYNMKEDLTFILAAIIRHDVITSERVDALIDLEKGTVTTFVLSLNARYEPVPWLVSEAELTFGTNPTKKTEENRDATILGIRLQEQFPISVKTKTLRQIVPVIEASFYWDDLNSKESDFEKREEYWKKNGNKDWKEEYGKSKQYEAELRGALALCFGKDSKFQFRNSFGTRLQIGREDAEGNKEDTRVARYRYNTQFVVIF